MSTNHMNTMYRNEKTYNGFSLDVTKSALQKYIRRCDARKAIYAGVELDLFYMMPDRGEGIRTNFIHRLMVIYMEDLFYPGMWEYMDQHVFELFDLRKNRTSSKREKEMENVCKIIYSLANSTHSRDNSYYRYCLSIYLRNSQDEKNKRVVKKFPFLKDLKEKADHTVFNPSFFPETLNSLNKNSVIYKTISQFIGSIEAKDDLCIYYGHLLADMEPPKKFYNSKKPAYMIFYLLNEVLGKDKKFKPYIEIGKKWYKELSPLKEDFLCWQTILLFWLKDSRKKDIKQYYEPYEEDEKTMETLYDLYKINLSGKVIEFDEWVYDMHTKIGKKRGKGSEYFATESSVVCNESVYVNQMYKNAYLYRKMLDDPSYIDVEDVENIENVENNKPRSRSRSRTKSSSRKERKPRSRSSSRTRKERKPRSRSSSRTKKERKSRSRSSSRSRKESKFSNFLVRAQLVTGNMKTDTYYGEKDGKVVFIKGPLKETDDESMTSFLTLQKKKKKLGLPVLNYEIVYLIPDLFGKTPLGLRNRLDREKSYPFIVCDTLFDHTPNNIPIRLHSSKLWPVTELVDFDKVKGMQHLNMELINDEQMTQLIETFIFRYVFGLGDLAPRNFIISKHQIYSIDEDIIDADFDFERNIKRLKGFFPAFKEYLNKSKNQKKIQEMFKKYGNIKLSNSEKDRFDWIQTYFEEM